MCHCRYRLIFESSRLEGYFFFKFNFCHAAATTATVIWNSIWNSNPNLITGHGDDGSSPVVESICDQRTRTRQGVKFLSVARVCVYTCDLYFPAKTGSVSACAKPLIEFSFQNNYFPLELLSHARYYIVPLSSFYSLCFSLSLAFSQGLRPARRPRWWRALYGAGNRGDSAHEEEQWWHAQQQQQQLRQRSTTTSTSTWQTPGPGNDGESYFLMYCLSVTLFLK